MSKMNKTSIFEDYDNGNGGQNWNCFKIHPHVPHLIILPLGSHPFSKGVIKIHMRYIQCHCYVAENFMACKVWHFGMRKINTLHGKKKKLKSERDESEICRKDGC